MRKVEVICGCWSELAIHAGYRTEKNEEQIAHVFQKELRRKTMSCHHSTRHPMQLRDPIAEEEVNCCCWSELAIHAGYPTAKNEEQIGHGVPEGAPKEDYKLPMFVVAIVASILSCFLIHDLVQQDLVAAIQPHIPCSSVTLLLSSSSGRWKSVAAAGTS
eukprot:s5528_g2.t2